MIIITICCYFIINNTNRDRKERFKGEGMSRRRAQSVSSNHSNDEEQGYISHRNSIDEGTGTGYPYSATPSISTSTSTSIPTSTYNTHSMSNNNNTNNNNNIGNSNSSLLNSTPFRSNSFLSSNTHGSLGVIEEDVEDDNVVLNPVLLHSTLSPTSNASASATSTSTLMHSTPYDSHNSV